MAESYTMLCSIPLKEVGQSFIEETDERVAQICMVQVVQQLLLQSEFGQEMCMHIELWP